MSDSVFIKNVMSLAWYMDCARSEALHKLGCTPFTLYSFSGNSLSLVVSGRVVSLHASK